MAWGDPCMCRKCGKMITFVRSHRGGLVPCDSFTVRVIPDKSGRLFYLGEGKTIWGRKTDANDPGGVTAWESHYGTCSNPEKKSPKREKKTPAQLAKAREEAAAERKRVEAALLARREKEWAAQQQ